MRVHKFLRRDATPLTAEAIQEIQNNKSLPRAQLIMCKKYSIGAKRYYDIVKGKIHPHPPEQWKHRVLAVLQTKEGLHSVKSSSTGAVVNFQDDIENQPSGEKNKSEALIRSSLSHIRNEREDIKQPYQPLEETDDINHSKRHEIENEFKHLMQRKATLLQQQ
jgi:hypothetical protein